MRVARSSRSARVAAAALAVLLLGSACSDDDDEPVESTAHESATTAPTTTTETDEADVEVDDAADTDDTATDADDDTETTTTTAAPTTTTTTEAPATTTTLAAEVGLPPEEERGENEAGVRIDLDETASLACANAEFAREALRTDLLDDALVFTSNAADRAEPSAVVELADLAPTMRAAQSADEIAAVIDQALEICVDLGHQI